MSNARLKNVEKHITKQKQCPDHLRMEAPCFITTNGLYTASVALSLGLEAMA